MLESPHLGALRGGSLHPCVSIFSQNHQKLSITVRCCIRTSVWKSLRSHSPIKIICMFHSSKKTTGLQIRMSQQSITRRRQQTVISTALKCVLYQRRPLKAFLWVRTYPSHTSRIIEDKGRFCKQGKQKTTEGVKHYYLHSSVFFYNSTMITCERSFSVKKENRTFVKSTIKNSLWWQALESWLPLCCIIVWSPNTDLVHLYKLSVGTRPFNSHLHNVSRRWHGCCVVALCGGQKKWL